MRQLLAKVPYPMAGLFLALATTGNLLMTHGAFYRFTFGSLALMLLVLLVAKIVVMPKSIAENFSNPVIASVMPAVSMGLMVLSTYLPKFAPNLAFLLWLVGLAMHVSLIVAFTARYIGNFSLKAVFPSYFIVYVGIVVASVTAPVFNQTTIGQHVFWFGVAAYLILLPLVIYRYAKVSDVPLPATPTFNIFAAPASLLLAGYLNSFPVKNTTIIYVLFALLVIMLAVALTKLPRLLKLPFYPSYSLLTFPFVITAVAVKGFNNYLIGRGNTIAALGYFVTALEIWSAVIVLYVLIRYIMFLSPAISGSSPAKNTPR